jgi:hypothetical protein
MTCCFRSRACFGQVLTHSGPSTAPIEPFTVASPGAANSAIAEKAIVITVTRKNHLTIRVLPCASTGAVSDRFEFHPDSFRPCVASEAFCCSPVTFCPKPRFACKSDIHRK